MNPKFVINEQGKKVGVFLDIKEYNALLEELEDLSDIAKAEERLKADEKTYSLEEIEKEILTDD